MIHARESNYGRRNSSKEGRASLADDIHSIRIALTGASATAKERTLKTLERLTARLALAESERDVALGKNLPHNKTIYFFDNIISNKNSRFLYHYNLSCSN